MTLAGPLRRAHSFREAARQLATASCNGPVHAPSLQTHWWINDSAQKGLVQADRTSRWRDWGFMPVQGGAVPGTGRPCARRWAPMC